MPIERIPGHVAGFVGGRASQMSISTWCPDGGTGSQVAGFFSGSRSAGSISSVDGTQITNARVKPGNTSGGRPHLNFARSSSGPISGLGPNWCFAVKAYRHLPDSWRDTRTSPAIGRAPRYTSLVRRAVHTRHRAERGPPVSSPTITRSPSSTAAG